MLLICLKSSLRFQDIEIFVLTFWSSRKTASSEEIRLTLSRRRPLSYRKQPTDLQSQSMDWFLYDNGLRLERVNTSKPEKQRIAIQYYPICYEIKATRQ